jgi:hypothetical protein
MEENGGWMQNMPTEKLALKEKAKIVDVGAEIWNRRPLREIAHEGSYHPRALGHELIADWLADYIKTDLWSKPKAAK